MKVYPMLYKGFYVSILFLLVVINLFAQHQTHLTHYSVDDGLSENHVLCMLQDKKGLMWFGTHSGLDRFDGYTFKNFKGEKNAGYPLLNYRLDEIKEDHRGALWIRTNDMNVYRFNPDTETFMQFPQCIEEFKDYKEGLNRITILKDGSIWLNRIESGFDACFRIEYFDSSTKMNIRQFSHKNGDILSDQIHLVYSDDDLNTWILSTGGVSLLEKDQKSTKEITEKALNTDYYSVCEQGKYIYFGGKNGNLIQYDKEKQTKVSLKIPHEKEIIEIFPKGQNEIILATNSTYFFTFNAVSNKLASFSLDEEQCSNVYGCYQDKNQKVWFDTDFYGAIFISDQSLDVEYLPVKDKWYSNNVTQNFYVVEDTFKNTWIQIRNGGLYKYNQNINELEAIFDDNLQNISDVTHSALADHQGNIWLSSYMQGIYKVVYQQPKFQFLKPNQKPDNALNNEVRAVFKDSKSNLWVGAKDGLTYMYDSGYNLKGLLCEDGTIGYKKPLIAPVYHIIEHSSGDIWLATKGMGIYTLKSRSAQKYHIRNYRNDPQNLYSLSSNDIYNLHEDRQRRVWIASFNGGLNIADNADKNLRFIHSKNLLKQYPIQQCFKVRFVTEDKKGNYYLGTTNGLLTCSPKNNHYSKFTFERFTHDPTLKFTLSGNDVQFILPSKNNDLYLALSGGSLNRVKGGYHEGEVPKFEQVDNLPPDIAYTLLEDSLENIWISTQTRIIKYDAENEVISLFKPQSGKPYFFSEAAASISSNNEIFYGTSNGLTTFEPDKLIKSNYVPPIFLDQLQVNNRSINVASNSTLLTRSLDNKEELILSHKQNNLSISYAAIDYKSPGAIHYAFYLEGLEDHWNYVEEQRVARYNKIPNGTFILHVKSTNSDEVWVDNEKTIKIIRKPSFWESNWGVVFYMAVILLLSVTVSYIFFIIYRLRNEVAVEHRISEMKLRFFTDISHELRTPLTLIISPIDNLLKKEVFTKSAKDQLLVVQKNTHRLLKLINQIMDFRKIQSNKMKLFIEAIDVTHYMNDICTGFKKLAEEQNIKLTIIDRSNNAQLWIDKDKFEKIFYNLLSNAFKFSRGNSEIKVEIIEEKEQVRITVQDQGIGISKDRLKLLFNRFESLATTKPAFQTSTGIGLSLIKELVALHHGEIEVESEAGKGSAFSVIFRKGYSHFDKNEEFILQDLVQGEPMNEELLGLIDEEDAKSGNVGVDIPSTKTKMYKVVIAEDNSELRTFLTDALKEKYQVFSANNGHGAIQLANDKNPDIIISDIMMPGMDGLELMHSIKGDFNTSHIPFILLTAKSNMDSKISAMEYGADDYITKPFSLEYLEVRIENLLKLRVQLQDYFKNSITSGVITLSQPNVTSLDQEFLQKITQFVEANFFNSEIVIDDIAEIAGVSRSSFFKKVKGLTGLAPVEFLREFRLQKSTQLIEAGENNVSQLAYHVGINDARYFSKCFKQKFGMTPKEFMAAKGNKK